MRQALRIAGACWFVAGLALCAQAGWGLVVEDHFASVTGSWLITLVCGVLAVMGGVLSAWAHRAGAYVLAAVSVLGVLYALAYFLLGGLDDAGSYFLGVVALLMLAIFTLYAFFQARAQAS